MHSNAGSGPMTRAPSVSTFMSSCSTPWWAEYVSWQTAARMPRILLAATRRADARAADQDAAVGVAGHGSRRRGAARSPGSRRSGPSRRRRGRSARGRASAAASRRISSSLSAAPAWSAANATRMAGIDPLWPRVGRRRVSGDARRRRRPSVGWPPIAGGRRSGRHRGSGCGRGGRRARRVRATSVTRSAVKPNFSKIVPAGADAPKWSSPMIAPSSPTQRSQPSETPTSTLTRSRTAGGRTASRYACVLRLEPLPARAATRRGPGCPRPRAPRRRRTRAGAPSRCRSGSAAGAPSDASRRT